MVTYRGIKVVEGWPEKIRKAQRISSCRPDGKEMARVRYGSEEDDWGANERPCHDCYVIKGEFHVPGCDVERCPSCGGQIIGCECDWSDGKSRDVVKKQPKPFSESQKRIVAARRQFRWRHVGFAKNGDAIFEITNESDMRLPYLSIGIQGRNRTKLIGGAYLNVSDVEPGGRGLVEMDCYKGLLRPDEVECFAKEDPTPETRNQYWEFKRLPGKSVPRKKRSATS